MIAFLIGGLDLLLGIVIVVGIAGSSKAKDNDLFRDDRDPFGKSALQREVLGGAMALICFNCLSVPLCVVGIGLSVIGLIVHRRRNHVFTWIGLFGNGIVVITLLGMYLAGAMMGP